jgi:hypothetical protein
MIIASWGKINKDKGKKTARPEGRLSAVGRAKKGRKGKKGRGGGGVGRETNILIA